MGDEDLGQSAGKFIGLFGGALVGAAVTSGWFFLAGDPCPCDPPQLPDSCGYCWKGMTLNAYWHSYGPGISAAFAVVGWFVGRQWE